MLDTLKTTVFGLALCLLAIASASGCSSTDEVDEDAEAENTLSDEELEADARARDDQGRRLDFNDQQARGIFMRIDPEDIPYSIENYDAFMQKRCVELGGALQDLTSRDPMAREVARDRIAEFEAHDNEIKRQAGAKQASGLIIPRYIQEELDQPAENQDLEWLSTQGVMLQANYQFESDSAEVWEEAAYDLAGLGVQGQEFLAMQMVIRLQSPVHYTRAQGVIVDFAAEQAAPHLVTLCHMQIGSQPNVISSRAADTLVAIGSLAVPEILKAYRRSDKGPYVPANDQNWRTRRFLSDALGRIGDPVAVGTLVKELDGMKISKESPRLLYTEVLVTALGEIADERGKDAILRAWRREREDPFFADTARAALLRITGRTWRTPDE